MVRRAGLGKGLGALIPSERIRDQSSTLRFDQNYEWIIVGCAIIVAVVLDQGSAQWNARRQARAAGGES